MWPIGKDGYVLCGIVGRTGMYCVASGRTGMYRVAEQGGQVCIIWHSREDGYVS